MLISTLEHPLFSYVNMIHAVIKRFIHLARVIQTKRTHELMLNFSFWSLMKMEDRRFYLLVKFILIAYNISVISFWIILLSFLIDSFITLRPFKQEIDHEYFSAIYLSGGKLTLIELNWTEFSSLNNEFFLVSSSQLFAITSARLIISLTVSSIGLFAVIKEWHDFTLFYAILETIFLIILSIVSFLLMKKFLIIIILLAVQTSITILAFGFSAAIAQSKKIEQFKIDHV